MSKVAFLNEYIKEEIYAKQLPRFEDPKELHYVYMLQKVYVDSNKLQE